MMEFKNKKVDNIKRINGKDYTFEHDSSEEAWEHYKIIYFKPDGSSRINSKYDLKNEKQQLVLCNYKDKKYYNEPNSKYPYVNRYYWLSGEATYDEKSGEYSGEKENLSGDCDFNFNERKYIIYERMIEDEYKDYPRIKKYALNLLLECNNMHHSLLNFSLIQTKGNMQGFKGGCLNNGVYASLDRADTLVSYLANYYKLQDYQKRDSYIIANAGVNKDTLKEYLDSFKDIYDYCKKIYLIDNEKFVDRMIKEGCLLIKTGHDVVRYMLLALEFWDRKEFKIKEIYGNIK